MDQRLKKQIEQEVNESLLRQMNRMEQDPPEVPVRAFVVVCTDKAAQFLEQSKFATSLESEAEHTIYRAFREALKEASSQPLEYRLEKLAEELDSLRSWVSSTGVGKCQNQKSRSKTKVRSTSASKRGTHRSG